MKKSAVIVLSLMLSILLCVSVNGETLEIELDGDDDPDRLYENYVESLPEDIRSGLKEDTDGYDLEYFGNLIRDSLKTSVGKAVGLFARLTVTVIIASAVGIMSEALCGSLRRKAFSFCSSLCMALIIWEAFSGIAQTARFLLESLTDMMLITVPVMEGILIYTGNVGSAAVTATGINLMITLGEGIFSRVLFPGAVICFFLSVSASVCDNGGIAYMSKAIRGLITGGLIAVMALMTFVLAMQNTAAGAADSFAARTVKFAVSSYLPIVGGTVSESLSLLSASMSVIKQTLGVTGIVVMLLAVISPLILLVADRISVGAAEALAGMLGCEREKVILSEAGGICTLFIAVCAGAIVMFLIAFGIFCRTLPALG